VDNPSTPRTRTLTPAESAARLRQDWLFQAMGESLRKRTRQEIGWARELADRLSSLPQPPDLSRERAQLEGLEHRLSALGPDSAGAKPSKNNEAVPDWIWYPEGQPAKDAPAEVRFFRCTFEAEDVTRVRVAELRIAADDACEISLNGIQVGVHGTWQTAAVFQVGRLLKSGKNVLVVRAENRPAPAKNPAGLIVQLTFVLADGTRNVIVSDGSWRAHKAEQTGWRRPEFDDGGWPAAKVAAPFGGGPWRRIRGLAG